LISAGAPLRELTALPQTSSCISGVLLLRKRREEKKQGEGEEKKNKRDGRGKRKGGKKTRSPLHVSGYATEKKRGKATKRERTKRTKKINGRRGEGRASELGGRLPPGAEGGWTPLNFGPVTLEIAM